LGVTVGVLAVQGDFAEHLHALDTIGARGREVRLPRDLAIIDALIIPGGESTTISRLLKLYDLLEPIRDASRAGIPIWGTCAGAILLAKECPDLDQEALGLMDITIRRNAFGRQLDSFETDLPITGIEGGPMHAVFIRAPIIERAGPGVSVLASLPDGRIVAAREANLLATSFHPELAGDFRFHQLLAGMAAHRHHTPPK
jgi:pyridoxal 5'-phosphate synthase pdxT subunit